MKGKFISQIILSIFVILSTLYYSFCYLSSGFLVFTIEDKYLLIIFFISIIIISVLLIIIILYLVKLEEKFQVLSDNFHKIKSIVLDMEELIIDVEDNLISGNRDIQNMICKILEILEVTNS